QQLWVSGGTADNTFLVKSIGAGTFQTPEDLTNVGGTLYFSAAASGSNRELWKSNGTSAGTVLVKEIQAGPDGSLPQWITDFGGTALFQATDAARGSQVWK